MKRFAWPAPLMSLMLGCLLAALLTAACREPMAEENAVYYWRTEWRLDSLERQFLQQHHINKVYCRFFDVVMDDDQEPVPNASLRFAQPVPDGLQVVPTVYITEDCMHQPHDALAQRLVQRVVQMCETHDVTGVGELQVDCDYTARSREVYYAFLTQVRREARARGLRLSVTIRLHQLSMAAPPADYGVLMLYNTGDPRRFTERNPVLDVRDVAVYASQLGPYSLPLAAAYPVYLWHRDLQGVGIDHWVGADELLRVKALVERERPSLSRTIITYHLDRENIQRYTPDVYEEIYHH